jgi:hypothetical protein
MAEPDWSRMMSGRDDSWRREHRVNHLRGQMRDQVIGAFLQSALWLAFMAREAIPAFLAICAAKYFGVI